VAGVGVLAEFAVLGEPAAAPGLAARPEPRAPGVPGLSRVARPLRAPVPGLAAAASASAAAADATSCCCGRDTSLARIAASTVIFIAGITASWPSLARPAHDGGPAARPLMVMIEIRWTVAERPRRPWRGAARTVAEHPRRP